MADITALNAEHGIPGHVVFKGDTGELIYAELSNDFGRAVVYLQGGHLAGWIPRDREAVIWLSDKAVFARGKAIRGGVPVCWPWFGDHPRDPALPAHGFARTSAWRVRNAEVTSAGSTKLSLDLDSDVEAHRGWPSSCKLTLSVTLGAALEIELVTRNDGDRPVTITEALHTYFAVGDIGRIAIHGLDGGEYLDKVEGMARKKQAGPVTFQGEVDRVYLNSAGDCCIDDPVLNRRIRIAKQGSRSTVVWNPWKEKAAKMADLGADGYLGMVCVESANAADDAVTIAAGADHRLTATYRLEPLPDRES